MDWKGLGGQLIKKGLPLLGGLLAGPVGALGARAAVTLLSSSLDLKEEEATPDDVLGLLRANPEALEKLKEAEFKHKERLQELLLEETRLEIQDVANARSREVELVKATGGKDINLYVMAYMVIAGFFGTFGVIIFSVMPVTAEKLVFLLLGGLISAFERVLSYFFGTSRSSREKTNLLSMKDSTNR